MRKWWEKNGSLLVGLLVVALYYWTFAGLDAKLSTIVDRWPQARWLLFNMVSNTDWAYWPELTDRLLETFHIAVLGTAIGAVLAIPFGFMGARNVARAGTIVKFGKLLLNAIRAFPELILAILFNKAVGLGPFPGILAMGIHSIGMLGKLYAEVVEAIDKEVLEAMAATGANRVQAVWFGVLPQVLPEFASYALYRFEINMRAAPILGMVGAGGIGHPLIFAVRDAAWGRVGIILLGIIVAVSVVDFASSWLRSRLV